MQVDEPMISVIIPVKNGDAWLGAVIPSILRQTLAHQTEIIVIDSGSTDRTMAILSEYPVRIITIDPGDFNHGDTRNLGVKEAKGRFVVMTVQDAVPADGYWLQHLLDGFVDEKVAGVCGQQVVPHDPDKNPVDWFRPVSVPGRKMYIFEDVRAFHALSPDEKRSVCSWDNVNAMYRRDRLLELPFRRLSFGEDAMWAKDALEAGYAIMYNWVARVNHYHFHTPDYTFKRCFTENYYTFKLFGKKPTPTDDGLIVLLKNIKLLLGEKNIGWKDKWKWLLFNRDIRKAINRSVSLFNTTLAIGETELDRRHAELCGSPPQANKPQLNN